MIAILVAFVLISSPSQVSLGDEFYVYLTVYNVTNLSAFQVDISYDDLKLLGVEMGDAIVNWTIFDYNFISPNKIRVIAAEFNEEPVKGGGILKLKFRAEKEGIVRLNVSGILSDPDGNEIKSNFGDVTIKVESPKKYRGQLPLLSITLNNTIILIIFIFIIILIIIVLLRFR